MAAKDSGIGQGSGIDVSQFTKCKINSVTDITPTIRALQLQVIHKQQCKALSFQPGQWVDFYVPHLNKLTGYSITSIPAELEEQQTLSLAVKQSEDLISKYVHSEQILQFEQKQIDIYLKVGGNLCFQSDQQKHYILVCGGIGITPLASIWKYYCKYCNKSRITLLYSVSTPTEFALLDELQEYRKLAEKRSEIVLTVTKYKHDGKGKQQESEECKDDGGEWKGRRGRIDVELIREYRDKYLEQYDESNCEYIICGPSGMIDEFNEKLQSQLHVKQTQIWFEKWW